MSSPEECWSGSPERKGDDFMKKTFLFLRVLAIAIVGLLLGGVEEARAFDGMTAYGISGQTTFGYSTWTAAGGFGTEATEATLSSLSTGYYVLKACPISVRVNEKILAVRDGKGLLWAKVWNGSAWGNGIVLGTQTVTSQRTVDVAYENLSGDAIIVFHPNEALGTTVPWYAVWNGVSWSSGTTGLTLGAGRLGWIRLEAKPGSDEILLGTQDGNSDVYGAVWNGSSWGNSQVMTTAAALQAAQCFDIAYEQTSGEGLFVFVDASTGMPVNRTWTGVWSSSPLIQTGNNITLSANASWLKLSPKAGSNEIQLLWLDRQTTPFKTPDLQSAIWDGANWGNGEELNTSVYSQGTAYGTQRGFDVAYERSSGDCLIVYSTSPPRGGSLPIYRTRASGATSFSAEASANGMTGGDYPVWVTLASDPESTSNDIFYVGVDSAATPDLNAQRWGGASWNANQELNTAIFPGNTDNSESYAFAFTRVAADAIPPAGISNLTALQTANEGEIRLEWNSPGDDGITDNLPAGSQFQIKYSTASILSSGDFDSPASSLAVVTITISTGPVVPLMAVTTTVFNLTGTTRRYFAIKTTDDSSNVSVWNSSADVATVNISALISPAQFPPGGISNLTALSGSVEGEIILRWKAPGDDGETGTLNTSTFSIKYSSINVITSANFDSPPVSLYVTAITISTTSIAAGINVSTTVSNLTVGTIYWFAIKTRDDLENWSVWTSSIDNTSFNTLASTVPGAILPNLFLNGSDISHTNTLAEPGIVVYVTATIRNNGGTANYTGPTFITFFATNTSTNTNYFISQATLGIITPALSGSTQAFSGAWTIPVEGLYNYWVKIDTANTIAESNENDNDASIPAEHPPKPPNGISNLTALTGPTEGQVILRWTAPGDDGTAGIVSGYALRIATAPIKSADFDLAFVTVSTPSWASNPTGEAATNVSGGTDVSITLTGLTAGVIRYFALRGIDDINQFGVWNSTFENASFNTLVSTFVQVDVTAPSAITTLSAALYSPTGIVTLTWTAPGEDGTAGGSGAATFYDIRYATFSFTDRTAAGVLVATFTPTPSTRGSNETFRIGPGYGGVISGLRSGQDYFFNVWSQDDKGNFSDVTSPEASTPVVHLVISEIQTDGATSDDEFVELFNPTTAAIDLSVMGLKLHVIAQGGADSNFALTIRPGRESIPSNGFWLITDRVGYTLAVSSDADFATGNNLAAPVNAGIAVYLTTATTLGWPRIDIVGMQDSNDANPGNFETTPSTNPSANNSIERRASGGLDPTTSPGNTQGNGFDENNNNTDFVYRTIGSDPQSSLSAVEGDTKIPGGISNLTALAQANGDVILEWTSPGDDEQTGDLLLGSQFRIKYSSVAIITSSNFDSPGVNLAVSTITISTTTTALAAQRRTITGLSGGIRFWFAIKTKDEVGNWSVWTSSADVLTINTAATVINTTHLGAIVDLASFDFGTLQPGTTSVSTSSGSVTNTGNITERFLVRVSSSQDFIISTSSAGANQFRYSILFSTATPVSADFGTNDAADTVNTAPTATVFARDGDGESVKGFNVAPGGTRFLWMRFEAPTSVSVNPQQNIFVTVVAEQQP